jgi:SulP family sulfate permease
VAVTIRRPRFEGGLPLFGGLRPIDPARIPLDMIAGATLAALAIPEVMGYTSIAGMPVVTGLYTILVPMVAFAILGSSRHLVVGADSATAAILAAGLAGLATQGSAQYVALAATLALMAAAFLFLARVLRLGFLANFLSRTVLIGFLTGVGIQVAIGQVPGMLGLAKDGSGPVEQLANVVRNLGSISLATTLVSVTVLAIIVGLDRFDRRIPGALIAVVGAIVLSWLADLAARGVSTLGPVPGGLPAFGIPQGITASEVSALLPTAFSIFIVILAQSAATSRAYAMRYKDSFDENVDLVGLGAANIAAGLSGTFVVNGSPTKTEMVDSAGGRSQLAQLTAAAIVLVVLLFLTEPLSYMPDAVLAAVVFLIGIRLIDVSGMTDIYRLRRTEFAVAAIAAAVVVVVGVEQGILLAMVLSIVEHISHSYRPSDRLVTTGPDGTRRLQPLESRAQMLPGLAVYRFGSGVYYANAARFTEEIMALASEADPALRWLGLTGSAIADIDYSAADSMRQVHAELAAQGVTLVLCDMTDDVRAELDAYGLTDLIGAERIFEDVAALAEAYSAGPGAS